MLGIDKTVSSFFFGANTRSKCVQYIYNTNNTNDSHDNVDLGSASVYIAGN